MVKMLHSPFCYLMVKWFSRLIKGACKMKRFNGILSLIFAFVLMIPATGTYAASNSNYQRAVSAGEELKKELSKFNSYINSGNLYNVDAQYDAFTKKIRNTELLIGKVSGSSNRNYLNTTYVRPAKIAKERVIYEISQIRLLYIIDKRFDLNQLAEAESDYAKLERLQKRAKQIKEAGGYESLPTSINRSLHWWESYIVERLNANTSEEIVPSEIGTIHDFLVYLNHVYINDEGSLLELKGWTMEPVGEDGFGFFLRSFSRSSLEKLDEINAKGNDEAVREWATNIVNAIDYFSTENGAVWYAYASSACQGYVPSSFPEDSYRYYVGSCGYTFNVFNADSKNKTPSVFYDGYLENKDNY